MFQALMAAIARELARLEIPYMVIGGQAVLLYGEPRVTRDIDITVGTGTEGLPQVLQAVARLGLKPLPEDLSAFVARTMVLPVLDEQTGIRVDFIFSFSPYERAAIERSKKVDLGGTEVSFASPEDVIIHKIFAHRPRDLEDARSIVLRNPNLDREYIRSWLREFDASFMEGGFEKIFRDLPGGKNVRKVHPPLPK